MKEHIPPRKQKFIDIGQRSRNTSWGYLRLFAGTSNNALVPETGGPWKTRGLGMNKKTRVGFGGVQRLLNNLLSGGAAA